MAEVEAEAEAEAAIDAREDGLVGVLAGADVVICCGSGGVGKTTTAAALGREAARLGRSVVVVTIDPARRLADALGLTEGLSSQPQRVPDAPGEMWAMMLDADEMFRSVIAEHAGDAEQADRILSNRFARSLSGSLSGTQEYMATEALYRLHDDDRFDLVVVDTPPSRQALDFLEAPGVLTRFLDHRVFRLLMMPTRRGLKVINTAAQPVLRAIGRVVGSDVLADAVAFFQAFSGMEAGFRDRARDVDALLRAPSTAFALVASPRPDTVAEAVWFAEQLQRHGLSVAAAIINRAQPIFGTGTLADAFAGRDRARDDAVLAAAWEQLIAARLASEAETAEIEPLIAAVPGAVWVTVPLMAGDVHDAAGLDAVGAALIGSADGHDR
jgi:anion-transporting  ArsA/GET3 family ATPase